MLHHQIYLFLGQVDPFTSELKRALQEKVPGFDDLIADVLNFIADEIERGAILLPHINFAYMKV